MRWKAKPLICFWLSYVVFLSSSLQTFNAELSPGRCWRQTHTGFYSVCPLYKKNNSGSVHTLFHNLSGVLLLFCWHKTGRRRLHLVCRRAPQNGQKDNNGTTSAIVLQAPRHHKTDERTTNEAPQTGEGWWRLPEYKHSIISAAFPIPSPCF